MLTPEQRKKIGLWEIHSYDTENIMLHADRVPGEVAWVGEKVAYLSKIVEDLDNSIENAESTAFLRAKGLSLKRVSAVKGGRKEEHFTPSDEVAKHMMKSDPTVYEMKQTRSRVRELLNRVKGYQSALEKKSVLVSGMVGIARDELRVNNRGGN